MSQNGYCFDSSYSCNFHFVRHTTHFSLQFPHKPVHFPKYLAVKYKGLPQNHWFGAFSFVFLMMCWGSNLCYGSKQYGTLLLLRVPEGYFWGLSRQEGLTYFQVGNSTRHNGLGLPETYCTWRLPWHLIALTLPRSRYGAGKSWSRYAVRLASSFPIALMKCEVRLGQNRIASNKSLRARDLA